MKLGFEESAAKFNNSSQNIRVLSERWVSESLFCPACGYDKLTKFENNRPAADFYCSSCREEFEIKSQKRNFGKKVVDGSYETLRERLSSANSPSFGFISYDPQELSVKKFFVVPSFFLTDSNIEKRRPLSSSAKRAGWIGSNILLGDIPKTGKIFIVKDRTPISKSDIVSNWRRTIFLNKENLKSRGWLVDVMNCIEKIDSNAFSLDEVYHFESILAAKYPNNKNVRPKIRQQLQRLRDCGYLLFLGNGKYQLR